MSVSALIFSGCATMGEIVPIKSLEVKEKIAVPEGAKPKQIQFKGTITKISRGTKVGYSYVGALCISKEENKWEGSKGELYLTAESEEVFRSELEKSNYKVVRGPESIFDTDYEKDTELLVGAAIKEMNYDLCFPNIGFGDRRTVKGSLHINVDWQIYSMLDRKVIFEISTEGLGTQKTNTDFVDLYEEAFRIATVNLLANNEFHEIVVRDEKPSEPFDIFEINAITLYERPISDQINNIRKNVVTVLAGPAHGSGFFIEKGLILTNAHVVEKTKFLKIKTFDGEEVNAELVRMNTRRDVALLKIADKQNSSALPLLQREIGVGSDVYAVGSPLDEKWSETVSRGVISGYRNENGLKLIQSDVNALPGNSGGPLLDRNGNVVGISQGGIMISSAPAGINFFIPIVDALGALNIRIK
jgi:hypothetical protein